MNTSFTEEEIEILELEGFAVKSNLQDAYKHFVVDGKTYVAHINVNDYPKYYVTLEAKLGSGEKAKSFSNLIALLPKFRTQKEQKKKESSEGDSY